jgi:hypothetical protein
VLAHEEWHTSQEGHTLMAYLTIKDAKKALAVPRAIRQPVASAIPTLLSSGAWTR